jgi:N6-adenosine-specific RNA methylase IME4
VVTGLSQRFGLVLADPPWRLNDQGSRIAPDYPTMTLDELVRLGPAVAELVADDAYLVLWVLSAILDEGLTVARAWGFEPKATLAWIKVTGAGLPRIGMGHHVRNAHELALVCTRGRPKPIDRSIPSWFADLRAEHSTKPDTVYEIAEGLSSGPYLELFARRGRAGWTSVGNAFDMGILTTP